MHKIVIAVFCMLCASSGRRVQTSAQTAKPIVFERDSPLTSLAMLLMTNNPAAAFNPSASGVSFRGLNPEVSERHTPAVMAKKKVKTIKLVLRIDVEGVGEAGEVVEVGPPGRAEKLLVGKALRFTKENVEKAKAEMAVLKDADEAIQKARADSQAKQREQQKTTQVSEDGIEMIPVNRFKVGSVYEGEIIAVGMEGALVDLKTEFPALLPAADLSYMNFHESMSPASRRWFAGDLVKCMVTKLVPDRKQMIVSLKAESENAIPIDELDKMSFARKVVTGKAMRIRPEGIMIDVGGDYNMQAFMPFQDIVARPKADKVAAIKKVIQVGDKVTGVLSHVNRDSDGTWVEFTSADYVKESDYLAFASLESGMTVSGVVKSIAPFGVFVDLGLDTETDGLLSDRGGEVEENYPVGSEINCTVQSVDKEKTQIRLALKDSSKKNLDEISEGDRVLGTVKSIVSFGIFVDIGAANDGLLHISQINLPDEQISQKFKLGDQIEVDIEKIEKDKKRISLTNYKCLVDREVEETAAAPEATATAVEKEEMRIDPADGNAYTRQGFEDFYGSAWPEQWEKATTIDN